MSTATDGATDPETVRSIFKAAQTWAKGDSASTIAGLSQFLASRGHSVTKLETDKGERIREQFTPKKIIPVVMTWKHHGFGGEFDTEIADLLKFFKYHMRLSPRHFQIHEPHSNAVGCHVDLGTPQPEAGLAPGDVLLLIYGGHGRKDKETHEWEMVSGGGTQMTFNELLHWCFCDRVLGYRDTIVILDACESGNAAQSFRRHKTRYERLNHHQCPMPMFLSASSWNTLTPASGQHTLTKRFARSVSELMAAGLPISMLAIYEKILQMAIETNNGCPTIDFAGRTMVDLVLKTGVQEMFETLHSRQIEDQVYNALKWLKDRPDLGSVICVAHTDCDLKDLNIAKDGYVDWVPWYKKITVAEFIVNWSRLHGLHPGKSIKVQYFGQTLEHDADLVESLRSIKSTQTAPGSSAKDLFILTALVEDQSNAFGGMLSGRLIRKPDETFGRYMTTQVIALQAVIAERMVSVDRKRAMQPFVEYYEKAYSAPKQTCFGMAHGPNSGR